MRAVPVAARRQEVAGRPAEVEEAGRQEAVVEGVGSASFYFPLDESAFLAARWAAQVAIS